MRFAFYFNDVYSLLARHWFFSSRQRENAYWSQMLIILQRTTLQHSLHSNQWCDCNLFSNSSYACINSRWFKWVFAIATIGNKCERNENKKSLDKCTLFTQSVLDRKNAKATTELNFISLFFLAFNGQIRVLRRETGERMKIDFEEDFTPHLVCERPV